MYLVRARARARSRARDRVRDRVRVRVSICRLLPAEQDRQLLGRLVGAVNEQGRLVQGRLVGAVNELLLDQLKVRTPTAHALGGLDGAHKARRALPRGGRG